MLIKDNNTELYHSATYLGKDYSDGIKHWKYLQKIETKPGQYRYIYYNPKDTKVSKKVYDAYMDSDQHGHNEQYNVNGKIQDWWMPDEKMYKKAQKIDFEDRVKKFKKRPSYSNFEAVLEQPLNKLLDAADYGKSIFNKIIGKKSNNKIYRIK